MFLWKAKKDNLGWPFVHEPFLFFIVSFVVSSGFPAILDYFRADVFRVKKSTKIVSYASAVDLRYGKLWIPPGTRQNEESMSKLKLKCIPNDPSQALPAPIHDVLHVMMMGLKKIR